MNNLIDILRVGVFAPKPAPALIWASESGLKYHIETAQSDAANGETFTALCGFTGLFQHQRNERHTFLRCFDCERIQAQSTTGILDVAARNDGLSCSTVTYGATGGEATATASPLQSSGSSSIGLEQCPSKARAAGSSSAFPTSLPVPLGREGASGSTGLREDREHAEIVQPSVPRSYCRRQERGISDSQILPEPFTLQQTGATASTSLSVVPENFSCFVERIDEFVAVRLPRIADCFCGRPSIHECPCGEPICANHSYASLCGTCTEAKQFQQSSVMPGADRYEGAR